MEHWPRMKERTTVTSDDWFRPWLPILKKRNPETRESSFPSNHFEPQNGALLVELSKALGKSRHELQNTWPFRIVFFQGSRLFFLIGVWLWSYI